jgi:hypothetical protein
MSGPFIPENANGAKWLVNRLGGMLQPLDLVLHHKFPALQFDNLQVVCREVYESFMQLIFQKLVFPFQFNKMRLNCHTKPPRLNQFRCGIRNCTRAGESVDGYQNCAFEFLVTPRAAARGTGELAGYAGEDDIRAASFRRPFRNLIAVQLTCTMTNEDERELETELARLQQEHRDLDAAIDALHQSPAPDLLRLQRLKKRKLQLRDRIAFIEDQITPDIIA